MELYIFDKLKLLADKTCEAFNFYASMDTTDENTSAILKERGISYYGLYADIANSLNIPEEIASETDQGFNYMADVCDRGGKSQIATKLRLCAKVTVEILEEMDLPEGCCPTREGTKAATAKVIAKYPELTAA